MISIIINLIGQLKYIGLFIGTFVEGPTVGLLSGFLIKVGILNLFWSYLVYVVADLSADLFYYYIDCHS